MKKILSGTIGIGLVVGIIASALWEGVFKPSSSWLLNILVSITTLGVKSFQNDIYREIAKGLHEDASLRVMVLLYTFLIAFVLLTATLYFLLKIYKNKQELRESKFYSVFRGTFDSKILIILYFVITLVFFALDLSRSVYINQAVTYYNQVKTIILPFITDEQSELFDSNFAQINNADDYQSLLNKLEFVAHENEKTLPQKPSIISSINYPAL